MNLSPDMLWVLPTLILSLTVHEFAHARTALAFGDDTAQRMGRCTLNPLAHLDLIGTLALIFAHFGWAKPVPVNPANLHPRRLGDTMVSLAGPMSNLILAILSAVGLRLAIMGNAGFDSPVIRILYITMGANVCLAVFNMIPLFPLDGHHILREQLPLRLHDSFMRWQVRFGMPVLLGIMFLPRLMGRPELSLTGRMFDWAISFLWNAIVQPGIHG